MGTADPHPLRDVAAELGSGTAAGIVSKFVDFPFDTVKVRMQADHCQYKSTIDCILSISRAEGLRGFYGGIAAPVACAAFVQATVFATCGFTKRCLRRATGCGEQSLAAACVGGACGGFTTSFVVTPMELVKCTVQSAPPSAPVSVPQALAAAWSGGVRGLYRGHTATLCRCVPGNASWFFAYETALSTLFIPEGGGKRDCVWYAYPVSGGIGGFCYWTSVFPLDVVKTRMQTDPVWDARGVVGSLRHMHRTRGAAGLYAGYGITVVRSFPVSAATFTVYEHVHPLLAPHHA